MAVETASPGITHAEARAMIDRALEKARELKLTGAFVVVDRGGNDVSASRIDYTPSTGLPISRAKAFLAAMGGQPTSRTYQQIKDPSFHWLYPAFQRILEEPIFPGMGGMLIRKEGRVVGAIATGPGNGPVRSIPGVDASALLVNGEQANAEDLLLCHALQIPYEDHHPGVTAPGTGAEQNPTVVGLMAARAAADRAIAEARAQGLRISVVVVDEVGQILQLDRMDGGSLMGPDVAHAKALTALNFRRPSSGVGELFRALPEIGARLPSVVRFEVLPVGGGVPILRDGVAVGAVGVSGATAEQDEALANAAIAGYAA